MKKFYEYNNQKLQEGAFSDENTSDIEVIDNSENSEDTFNATPIVAGGITAAGLGVGGYVAYKAGKKLIQFLVGGGAAMLGKTISDLKDAGTIAGSMADYNKEVSGAVNAMKSKFITSEGKLIAKELNTIFKTFGISDKKTMQTAIKLVMSAGDNVDDVIKNLKYLKDDGKISKYTIDKVEDFLTDPKNTDKVKKLINADNTLKLKNGKIVKKTLNTFGNFAKRMGGGTFKIGRKLAGKALTYIMARTAGKILSRAIPYAGWALLAWDAIEVTMWLAGDSNFYEPEEGWSGAKHGRAKLDDSKKTYNIIGTSITTSIALIGGSVNKYFKEASNDENTFDINYNFPSQYNGKYNVSEEEMEEWTKFVIDLDKGLTDSPYIANMNKLLQIFSTITADITSDFNSINITGKKDAEDWEVIKDAGSAYSLDDDSNIYGVEVAEDLGSFFEYFFIPGLNSMGWATVFTSEQYLESMDKEYGFAGDFNILEFLYVSHKKINLTDITYDNFDINSFKNVVTLLLGNDFYNKHQKIFSKLEYGSMDGETWKKIADINKYVEMIGSIMNTELNSIYNNKQKMFAITKPILSIAAVYAIYGMLSDILKSGAKYFTNVYNSTFAQDVVNGCQDSEIEEGIQEDEDEDANLQSELEKADRIESGKGEIETNDTIQTKKSEFQSISGYGDYL